MEKVAIIGMGTSGMAVAAAYDKEVETGLVEIDCFDSLSSFGRGFPYREDSDELILNLKTNKISYDYENNDDFTDWINQKKLPLNDYSSRKLFGSYTKDRLESTLNNIGANKIFEKIKNLDWIEAKSKWELEDTNGNNKLYDRIHLCAGELPQSDPYNLKPYNKYINSVFPAKEKLKNIKADDTVTVVGLGLTAVDTASYLLNEKNIKRMYMFSRTNVIPTVRVEPVDIKVNFITLEKISQIIQENNGLISFGEFDYLFNKELRNHGVNYEDFLEKHMSGGIEGLKTNINEPKDLAIVQALLPPMNLVFNKVWVSLTETDRILFREKYHPFMCLNRSPLPLPSAEILIQASEDGRLEILKGVKNIKSINDGHFEILGNMNKQLAKSDWVCNSTGLDTSLKTLDRKDSLIGSLIDKRYIQADNYGGISVLPEDMSAISPRFGNLPNFHVHGVLASGVQYRNNSTLIIQKTAHDLIKKLY